MKVEKVLIGEKYKIESTVLQYTIFEKTTKIEMLAEKLVEQATTDADVDVAERIDSEGWRPIAYVGNLKAALKFLIDHDIKGQGMDDIQKLVRRIAELHLLIDAADIGMPKPISQVVEVSQPQPAVFEGAMKLAEELGMGLANPGNDHVDSSMPDR